MAPLLKNFYNEKYIELLCKSIKEDYINFESNSFTKSIFSKEWNTKELKDRMRHISTTLGVYLPSEYIKAISILKLAFKKMNFAYGLENMIFQDFVEVYGLNELKISLDALETFTINSSSEFSIRRFIIKYPQESMKQMILWAKSDNEHIRRLASEGSRPRLPWAIALPLFKHQPKEILEILEILKDDESAYVRKSVANSLNDISKDNPQIVIQITKEWINYSRNRNTLLKHGCRTLLKASNKETLELFGFKKPTDISLKNFTFTDSVKMGEDLAFSFELRGKEQLGKLRVEFALYFLRKNSKQNKKVFKISEGTYSKSNKSITKIYSFKPISTRIYYKGLQKLTIIVNGVVFKEVEFMLF